MSDLIRRSKKGLSLALTVTTIVWSVGLFSLLPVVSLTAQAAAGDLVKSANSSAVYLVGPTGTTIHVFPHENVYKSWGYMDFKKVTTTDLSGFTVGNPVSFKDGSMFRGTATGLQGKDKTAVFFVSGSKIRDVVSAEVYQALFNDANWARVTWVPDDLLSKFNYPLGTQVTDANTYPDGALVKESGSSTVYVVQNGQKRAFSSSSALSANRFKSADAITITKAKLDAIPSGTAVSGLETALATPQVAQIVGGEVPVPKGTGLTVTLASDTPAAGSIISDNAGTSNGAQALAPVAKWNFTASSDGSIKITTIKVTRGGVSADSDISNAYLYDGNTRVAETPAISSTVLTFKNSAGIFTVPAGTTKAITMKFDIINSASSGKTIAFRLNAASDVVTDGAQVNGSFPMEGNKFTTANVTDLGKLVMSNSAPTAAANVDANQTNYEIWRYTWASSNQDIEVRKVTFTIVGSMIKGDLRNFTLYDGGTLVAGPVEDVSDTKTVTFMPSPAFKISSGVTKTMSVRADIVTGSNHTFRATLQKAADVEIYDRNYNVFLKEDGTDTFAIEQPNSSGTAVDYTIAAGTLTVSKSTDSPTGNLANAATGVTLAKFDFKATGEAVKITAIEVWLKSGGVTGAYANLKNGKLFVDGAQIGTTQTLSKTSTTSFSLGNSLVIPSGATKTVSVVADLVVNSGTALADGNTIILVLDTGSSNGQAQTSLTTLNAPAANIDGNTVTVRAGVLTPAANTGLPNATIGAPTGVIGQQSVKIASFTVTTGAGESVDLTQIVIKNSATAGLALGNDFQNLKLLDSAGKQLGTTQGSLSTAASGTYTFTPATTVNVPAGGAYVVDVYADILSAASNTSAGQGVNPYIAVVFDSVSGTGKTTGTSVSDTTTDPNGQQVYIAASGTLTITQHADTPIANIYQASQAAIDKQIDVYKFQLTATNEDMLVTRVLINDAIVSNANGATTTVATSTLTNFELYDGATKIAGPVPLTSSSNPTNGGYVDFSGLNYTVLKNSTKVLGLKAYVNRYDQSASGSTHTFSITPRPLSDGTARAITARGVASSVDKSGPTATSTGNALTIRKNFPVVEYIAPPTGQKLSQNAADMVLYKFKVTAQAGAQSVRLKKMTFRVTITEESTTTNALTLSNFELRRDGIDRTNYTIWGQSTTTATTTAVNLSATDTLAWGPQSNGAGIWVGSRAGGSVSTSTLVSVIFGATGIKTFAADYINGGEEEIAPGATVEYTLLADISGGGTGTNEDGDLLSVVMPGELSSSVLTGDLAYQEGYEGFRVGTTQAYFIWSDYSASTDHTYTVPSTGKDWTTGYQVRSSATSNQYLPLQTYTISP